MKTSAHLTLLALLSVISASNQTTAVTSSNSPTTVTASPPTATTAPTATVTTSPSTATTAPTATVTASASTATTAPTATVTASPSTATTAPTATVTASPSTATTAPTATVTASPSTATTAPTATVTASPSTATTAPTATVTASPSTATTAPTATVTASPSTATTAPTATVTASPSTATTAPTATVTASPSTATTAPTATVTASPSTATTAPTATVTNSPSTATTAPTATVTASPPTATTAPTATANATVSSVTPSSVTSSKPSSTIPDIKGPCQKDSCSSGSSCVNLNKEHFCLCIDGYYYKSEKCNKGKTFPGIITVKVIDTSDLENTTSEAYEQLHTNVTEFFENAFANVSFGQTVIHNVRISPSARSEMRADGKVVDVTVVNLFPEDTKEEEVNVSSIIAKAIQNNSVGITSYSKQDRCDFYGCTDEEKDGCSNGFLCKCKTGMERPNPQTAVCLPKCPDTCTEKYNKQCLTKNDGNPECVCLPGYKMLTDKTCQECAFGYSGVNCEEQFQLILVIVGSIAGILILGMVIALILVRSKKQKDAEEENLIENDFQNLRLQTKTTGFSNPGADGSIFPKVRANFSRDNQLQNPYLNHRGMPSPDY